jgi:stage III sporulation protein AD
VNPLYICAFAVISLGALSVIKHSRPEIYSLAVAAAGIAAAVYIVGALVPFIETVRGYASAANADGIFEIMLKALAVALCCRFGADICRDCGENTLAEKVELAGRAGMVLLGLPIIKQLLDAAKDMMQ